MNTPPTNNPENPENPVDPDNSENAAWEEAMSRDFDARVRDLHEAPLDMSSVKGKAQKIRRNRRAAVAGSILGVAAIVTPVAVLMGNGDTASKEPQFAPEVSETAQDPANGIGYLQGGTWHQADGDEVPLPENAQPYTAAVLWNDQLVATRWDGEVYSVADVIGEDGEVVDSFSTTGPVVVNDAGTTIAWVDADGEVMTRWDDDEVSLGQVDLSAAGEAIAWSAAAVTGGPDCNEDADVCQVYLNSTLGEDALAFSSHGTSDVVAPGVRRVLDATDDVVSVLTEVQEDLDTCGGLVDLADGTLRWETCDHQVWQVSPNGDYVAAPQSQFDGIGPTRLSILDAGSANVVTEFEEPGWTVATWAWSSDGSLVFSAVEGTTWHLMAMTTDGDITEIADPASGEDYRSVFTIVSH